MAGGPGLALPDRCTEVLYHTSDLAGDRLGRGVCIQDIWRASRPVLSARFRGAGVDFPALARGILQSHLGPHPGRWGVSRIFGALLALSCQLRGMRARRPRSQGDMQSSRMHPLTGRSPDHWGELPDPWRLRPGRWVWPHLTDNQLACTHNNPGYTLTHGVHPRYRAACSWGRSGNGTRDQEDPFFRSMILCSFMST